MNKRNISRFILIGIGVFSLLLILLCCTACGNRDVFDTVYSYEYAIIYLPNGEVVEGKVTNWTDYEDGDQIQVKIEGKTYLVHSSNIVLISE